MTISQNELQERVLLVLDQHLGLQDVPEVARSIMAEFIVSAVSAAKENRIGRAWDAEKSITAKKLEKIAQLLERLSKEMSDLNPLAKELLGREKGGFLPLSTHDLDHFYWAGTEMGDTSAVIEHIPWPEVSTNVSGQVRVTPKLAKLSTQEKRRRSASPQPDMRAIKPE
jgi:hypothetical protein